MGKNSAITCANCGADVSPGLLFCPACGSLMELTGSSESSGGKPESNDVNLSDLGSDAILNDVRNVGGFGSSFGGNAEAGSESSKPSMRSIAIVIIAVLLVLGIVCASLLLSGNRGQGEVDHSVFVEYESKLNEIINRYGEPNIVRGEQWEYATGLVFARLLDFGDDCEYLALAYYDSSKDTDANYPAGYPESYQFEIWAPAMDAGIKQVFSGTGSMAGQNVYCVKISYLSIDGKAYVLDGESQYGPEGYSYSRLWGVDASGEFGVLKTARSDWGTNGSSLEVDGVSASKSEYDDLVNEWIDNAVVFYPTTLDSSTGRDVAEIIATVGETFDELDAHSR